MPWSTRVVLAICLCLAGYGSCERFEDPGIFISEINESDMSSQIRFIQGTPKSIFDMAQTPNATGAGTTIYQATNSRNIGLNYDADNSLLFWADNIGKTITKYSLLNNTVTTIYRNGSAVFSDLAVDWLTNHVYWIDTANQRIMRCDYNGNDVTAVVSSSDLTSLALEPHLGYMYWSTAGPNPAIHRSTLAGQHRIIIFQHQHSTITGLTIQYGWQRDNIFWITNKIYFRWNLEGGGDPEALYYGETIQDDIPSDFDYHRGYFAVSDYAGGSVDLIDMTYPAHDMVSLRSLDLNYRPTSAIFFDPNRQSIIPNRVPTEIPALSQTVPEYMQPTLVGGITGESTEHTVTNGTYYPGPSISGPSLSVVVISIVAVIVTAAIATAIVVVICYRKKVRERGVARKRTDDVEHITFRALPERPWQHSERKYEPMYVDVVESSHGDRGHGGVTAPSCHGNTKDNDRYQPLVSTPESKYTGRCTDAKKDEGANHTSEPFDDGDDYENVSGYVPPDTGYVQPDTVHNQPEDGYVKPDVSNVQSDIEGYVKCIGTQPDTNKVLSNSGKDKPSTVDIQPDTGIAQPDSSEYVQPDRDCVPDEDYVQPDNPMYVNEAFSPTHDVTPGGDESGHTNPNSNTSDDKPITTTGSNINIDGYVNMSGNRNVKEPEKTASKSEETEADDKNATNANFSHEAVNEDEHHHNKHDDMYCYAYAQPKDLSKNQNNARNENNQAGEKEPTSPLYLDVTE